MKNLLYIITICYLLFSCNSSFETKLIDEPILKKETSDIQNTISKHLFNATTIAATSVLDKGSRQKIESYESFKNIIVEDSLGVYYVIKHNKKQVLIQKKDVLLHLKSYVILNTIAIFSKPDMTKKQNEKITLGTIILISSEKIGDFYKARTVKNKDWFFIMKEKTELSEKPLDLVYANKLAKIRATNDPLIENKLLHELQQDDTFLHKNWLPQEEQKPNFDMDVDLL